MLDLGTLKIGIELVADKAKKQLENLGNETNKTNTKFGKLKSGLLKATVGFTAVATASVLVAKRIKKLVDATAKYGDEIDKNSQKMNISAENYQKWDYVLQRNGSSISALKTGMKTLTTQIESGGAAFDKLGIKTKNADGSFRDTNDILNESLTALAGVKDETERAALASELFGKRTAQELLPTLNSGADGIEELQQRAEDLGFIMSDEAVKACADYEDAMLDVDMATTGLKNGLTVGFAELITPYADNIAEAIGRITEKVNELVPKVEEFLGNAISWITENSTALKIIGAVILTVVVAIKTVIAAINAYTFATKVAAAAQAALNLVMSANPIGLVVIAIAALVAAVVIAYKNSEKFRNAVNKLWSNIKAGAAVAKAAFESFKAGVVAALERVKSIIETVKKKWEDFKSAISKKVKAVMEFPTIQRFIEKVQSAIGWWKDLKNRLSKKITAHVEQKNSGGIPKRVGLREVPYDGYLAELHKGEAVLTAAETNQYRKWLNQQAQATSSEQPQTMLQAPIDYDKLATTMINALSGMNINTEVNVSGRTIAQATAPFMKTEINSLERRANRALGLV
jgi:hypothetical protein